MEKKNFHSSERPLSPARNSNTIRNAVKVIKDKPQTTKKEIKTDKFMIKKPNDSWDY